MGDESGTPRLVKAKTQAEVLDHLLQITLATPEDLIDAGNGGWSIMDLVNPAQLRVDEPPRGLTSGAQTAANGDVAQS